MGGCSNLCEMLVLGSIWSWHGTDKVEVQDRVRKGVIIGNEVRIRVGLVDWELTWGQDQEGG